MSTSTPHAFSGVLRPAPSSWHSGLYDPTTLSTLSSLLLLSSLELEVLAARAMKHVRTGHLFGVDLGEFRHLALVNLMHEPRVGYDERLVEPADLLC